MAAGELTYIVRTSRRLLPSGELLSSYDPEIVRTAQVHVDGIVRGYGTAIS